MARRRALITGMTGHGGSYLTEFLLQPGYEIFGMVRRVSTANVELIAHLEERIEFREGDTSCFGNWST